MDFEKTIRGNRIDDLTKLSDYIYDNKKIKPYVTIPVIGSCMFNCIYCRNGGEVTLGSGNEFLSYDNFKFMVDCAIELGIGDFRITGGEPFLHPDIMKMIRYLISREKYLLVNTNGMINSKLLESMKSFSNCQYLNLVVSLDSLDPETFDKITGSKNNLQKVIDSIFNLKEKGLLKRINMVITKLNKHEIGMMIDFCKKVQTNLSLLESISVPSQFCKWGDLKTPLENHRRYIEIISKKVFVHEYTKNFGVPILIYKIGNIFISFKSLLGGGQYSDLCKKCNHFPCHAGLHHIKLLPDLKISVCRWKVLGDSQRSHFKEYFQMALEFFEKGKYVSNK